MQNFKEQAMTNKLFLGKENDRKHKEIDEAEGYENKITHYYTKQKEGLGDAAIITILSALSIAPACIVAIATLGVASPLPVGAVVATGAGATLVKRRGNAVRILRPHINSSPEHMDAASEIVEAAFTNAAFRNSTKSKHSGEQYKIEGKCWHALVGEQRPAKFYVQALKALEEIDPNGKKGDLRTLSPKQKQAMKQAMVASLTEHLEGNGKHTKSYINRITNFGHTRHHIEFKSHSTKGLAEKLVADARNTPRPTAKEERKPWNSRVSQRFCCFPG
jgi:hypothetical protein